MICSCQLLCPACIVFRSEIFHRGRFGGVYTPPTVFSTSQPSAGPLFLPPPLPPFPPPLPAGGSCANVRVTHATAARPTIAIFTIFFIVILLLETKSGDPLLPRECKHN